MPENRGAIISRLLDTVGDESGSHEGILDYSDAPGIGATEFKITPPVGQIYVIKRMIASYEDVKNWNSDLYGKAIALTNGISVHCEDDSGVYCTLTDVHHPIKTNGEWAAYCYDFTLFAFGTGNDWAAVRWTFAKSGKDVTLDGDQHASLVVTLNDDFTDLLHHHFLVQGYRAV